MNRNAYSDQLLEHVSLFQGLSPEESESVLAQAECRHIRRGGAAYQLGQASDHIFLLTKGAIKIAATSADGREVIKQIIHPVTIFGELGLVGEQQREDSALALAADTQVYALPVQQLQNLMRTNHQLSQQLLQWIGGRLRRTENRLESLLCKDARERIIDFLRDSALRRGQRVGFETLIKHSLTQQDIANLTGTSRQTVTSVLNDLRKSNLIYFNRRSILIRDLGKLS